MFIFALIIHDLSFYLVVMYKKDIWLSIQKIISEGFTIEGQNLLDKYAEQFISHRIIYQRFSPSEQHGCATGGATHVVASLLAAAEVGPDRLTAAIGSFKREKQLSAIQESRIEHWAKAAGCWIDEVDEVLQSRFGNFLAEGGEAQVYDNGMNLIKTIGLDYYIQPLLALDRISLHNTWFPETKLQVLGFGRRVDGKFVIVVEQPFIQGMPMGEKEIRDFAENLGFQLVNPSNWTYATPEIYLSDLHDENVIKSQEGNVYVVDCDIRLNTPELKCGGKRSISNVLVLQE